MNVKTERQCRRCGNVLDTSGSRGLCLSCLSLTTTHRFSSSDVEGAGDDLKLEEGVAVGPQDRFLLHDRLGVGGMGEVWLATDQELSRDDEPYWVALKFLSEAIRNNRQALAAVRTEVIRSQELNHPNIVRVFDLHTTAKGMPFIKMEYVKGKNLVYWLEDCPDGVMHWREVVEVAQQLCHALQYAHETAGIVHRDIKPGNLILRHDRILKVADFGIAEALYTTRAASLKQKTLGTIWYASPQQLVGQRPTPADDIHALGATLYELLTGEPPFTGEKSDGTNKDSAEALIQQVRFEPAEPIRERLARRGIENEIPPKLVTLIHRCLEKEPQARPLAREILALLPAPSGSASAAAQVSAPSIPISAVPPKRPTAAPRIVVPPADPKHWEEPAPRSSSGSRVFVWCLFLAIAAGAAAFNFRDVFAKGAGALQVDVSGLENAERTVAITNLAAQIAFEKKLDAGATVFATNLPAGTYSVTLLEEGHEPRTWSGPLDKKQTNRVVFAKEVVKTGTLELSLSLWTSRAAPHHIAISRGKDSVVSERDVNNDEAAHLISMTLDLGEYNLSIQEPDGYAVTLPFSIVADQKTELRPATKPEVYGNLVIDLTSLKERKQPRKVELRKIVDGVYQEPISYQGYGLLNEKVPEGTYEVRMIETLTGGGNQTWTMIATSVVSQARAGRVVFAHNAVSGTIRSTEPGTIVRWPSSLMVPDSVEAGPQSPTPVLLPIGIFPVLASKVNYVQEPPIQWFTNKGRNFELNIKMRFSPTLNDDLPYWTNSIYMKVVSIPVRGMEQKWVAVTETTVREFGIFMSTNRYEIPSGMVVVTTNGFEFQKQFSWRSLPQGFDPGYDFPVVGVNYADAKKFCEWLTDKELQENRIKPGYRYRLPTAEEWTKLAGGGTYPWGSNANQRQGNYSGPEVKNAPGWPVSWLFLRDFSDGYARLAPAAQFANSYGLYNVAGNAAEWLEDQSVAGGSWADGAKGKFTDDMDFLKTENFRKDIPPEQRNDRVGFRVIIEKMTGKGQASR